MSTPNDLYQPFGRIDFYEYKEFESSLYIVVSINVWLRQGEYLELKEDKPSFPSGSYSTVIHFEVKGQMKADAYYLCENQPALVLVKSGLQYSEPNLDLEGKRLDIKKKIESFLKIDNKPTYTVFSIQSDIVMGSETKGSVTNTISEKGDVEIS